MMKNSKLNKSSVNKKASPDETKESKARVPNPPLDDDEQGFGGWLRSTDGMETMKLFVIANSIVMLTTVAYPHVQTAIDIIKSMIYESTEDYE